MESRRRPDRRQALAVPALVLLGALVATSAGATVLSPGPLSRAHADLDSATTCFRCHGVGEHGPGDRCIDCHKEIGWLVERGRGLHGSSGQPACANCHPEHAGREFNLVPEAWNAGGRFDHARTGWPLRGKHAATRCEDCHAARFRVSEALALSPRKTGAPRYLGLEPDCASCHADPHQGSEGNACQRCHLPTVWKPAAGFDHKEAKFRLDGGHVGVACEKCHRAAFPKSAPAGSTPVRIFQPVPHAECAACHDDPHRTQLGPQCSRCHVTGSFHTVNREAFDHGRTRYPLLGRHASVACAACHDPARGGGKKPSFDACADCHEDPHAGKATLAGRKVDCAACHGIEGFQRSTLPIARHQESAFPLVGKHLDVTCDRCHRRVPGSGTSPATAGKAGVLIRPAHGRCIDCHADSHGGQFADRPGGGECRSCHDVAGWTPSVFSAGDHAKAGFELTGRHAVAACVTCHGPRAKGPASRARPEDVGKARLALRLGEVACAACHGAERFRPSVMTADAHGSLGFPLEGAHRTTPCEKCHTELRGSANGIPAEGSGNADTRCARCHATPHGDQFDSRPDRGACGSCHDVTSFRPASWFRHDRGSRFPLLRSHFGLECGRCHATETTGDGRVVTRYRPLSMDCKECHRRTKAQAAEGAEGAPPRRARRASH